MEKTNVTTPPRWLMAGAALLAITAVFPFGWLETQWPAFGTVMYYIFDAEAAHVIGHFMLMGAVGTAVLLVFPPLRHRPAIYFAIMFGFGLAQEILQLLSYKKRPFAGTEWFDIAVDLIGATVVFILFRIIAARQENAHGNA
jgi:uncharacterized membrane protein YeaQ/YmgE (transglycosylase-associated protein family)